MNYTSTLNKNLAKIAGFEVVEDVDQTGLWVWLRRENGLEFEGSDISFGSEKEAWDNALYALMSNLFEVGEISEDEWENLNENDQENLIRSVYGF